MRNKVLLASLVLALIQTLARGENVGPQDRMGVYRFVPYAGVSAGAWRGDFFHTGPVGGPQVGVYGPSLGLSFMGLYYERRDRLVPLMANVFFGFPIGGRTGKEKATVRIGGGASYLIMASPAVSDLGSQANAGFDYWFTRRAGLGLDFFYFFFNPVDDPQGRDIRVNSAVVLLTLKYRFNTR